MLGKPVWETKQTIPATEFIRWVAYFEKHLSEPDKQEKMLARIAHQIYLLRLADVPVAYRPAKILEETDFEITKKIDKDHQENLKVKKKFKPKFTKDQARINYSKSVWSAFLRSTMNEPSTKHRIVYEGRK